jgi:hypothetical protein
MIIAEIGYCLRPLAIVLNEQHNCDGFSLTPNLNIKNNILFSSIICSFITNPYGRVHAISVMIIHGAVLLRKTPRSPKYDL